jgi:hypothetical protein
MNTEDYVAMFAGLFLGQLPTIVISSFGLWFAISRRARLDRVAKWAIWGFGMLIAYSCVSVILRVVILGIRTNERLQGTSELGMSIARVNLWGMAAYPLFICGLAVLARAIFLDRDAKQIEHSRQQTVAGAA